jgi:hypothetical protein
VLERARTPEFAFRSTLTRFPSARPLTFPNTQNAPAGICGRLGAFWHAWEGAQQFYPSQQAACVIYGYWRRTGDQCLVTFARKGDPAKVEGTNHRDLWRSAVSILTEAENAEAAVSDLGATLSTIFNSAIARNS